MPTLLVQIPPKLSGLHALNPENQFLLASLTPTITKQLWCGKPWMVTTLTSCVLEAYPPVHKKKSPPSKSSMVKGLKEWIINLHLWPNC